MIGLVELPLTLTDGPLPPPPRCGVCGAWRYRPLPPPAARWTYAAAREHWVKIGMSANVAERLSVLRRATEGCVTLHPAGMDWTAPLTLLAAVRGDIEHELHERFEAAHAGGEWFRLADPAVSDWVTRAGGPR